MTTIDPTSIGLGAATGVTGTSASPMSGINALDGDAFMKLMVAQMRYQNPLEPSDPGDMMLQTAQFTQVETLQQMVELQQRDLGLQEAVMAAGLIGDQVTAVGADGVETSGTVEGVSYTAAGPVLSLSGADEVALGQVTEIRRAAAATA